jgi:hypothetical protein
MAIAVGGARSLKHRFPAAGGLDKSEGRVAIHACPLRVGVVTAADTALLFVGAWPIDLLIVIPRERSDEGL